MARPLIGLILCFTLQASGNDVDELSKAAFDGDVEKVRELLNKSPELINGDGKAGSPLLAATFLARKEVIELLISKGADVNLPGQQQLVPKGGDDQMPKPLSITPLHLAAYQGYADIAKILLASKADPMAKSEDGTTPLHTAAAHGRTEVVKVLVEAKADVNSRDNDGATPLHYSAAMGPPETYVALAAAGADVDAVAEKGPYAGKTPRQMTEHVLPDESLRKSVNSMRILAFALHGFAMKHESFPNRATANALAEVFRGSVEKDPSCADDFLNQVALTHHDPALLDACMTGEGNDKRWICSYIPRASPTSDAQRPVALLPLIHGKRLFDFPALSGKAVVLFADGSVRSFPVEPDGRVLINEMDIFDPKQPFWQNSEPDIQWPKPSGK